MDSKNNKTINTKDKKYKKKKKKKKIFLKFFIIICFFISIMLGVTFGVCKGIYNGDVKKMLLDISLLFMDEAKPINILVIGISEDIETELADTIMFCSYNPEKQNAFVVSIPRDTFVGKDIAKAKGSDKINSKYKKGIENIQEYAEELIGLDIDKYVVVKTSMLVDIVDSIGGVDFDVPINMKYDDPTQNLHINLSKGMQKIDGDKAEQLLRFRHNNDGSTYSSEYGNNDLGRMRTQREFIKVVIEQTIDIKNIFKIKDLVNVVFDKLETDMDKSQIISYIPYVLNFDINTLKLEQLPGESKRCNGVWVYAHDKKSTDNLIEELTIE